MKLTDIILSEISVSGEVKKVDTIVGAVSKAVSEKYDIPNDGLLQGTIRVAVAEVLSVLDEGINDHIEEIIITYNNYGQFYKMHVDGEKLYYDEASEMIIKVKEPQPRERVMPEQSLNKNESMYIAPNIR